MKRFQCAMKSCTVVWIEQEDGSMVREEPGKGCFDPHSLPAEDVRRFSMKTRFLKEIPDEQALSRQPVPPQT